jgi:hypothetical protein
MTGVDFSHGGPYQELHKYICLDYINLYFNKKKFFGTLIKKYNLTRFITFMDRSHFYEAKTGLVFF